MFSPLGQTLALAPDQLELVRFSLNQPVVSTAELAPGPARAAILVHTEGLALHHTVAVRPVRDGNVVLYQLDELDLVGDVALDASLSFAESMGFLFDDEAEIDPGSKDGIETLERLSELLGDRADTVGGEILLEEVAARESTGSLGLSKFRVRVPRPISRPTEAANGPPGLQPVTVAEAPRRGRVRADWATNVAPACSEASTAESAEAESKERSMLGLGRRLLGRVRPVRRRARTDAPGPVLRLLSWF